MRFPVSNVRWAYCAQENPRQRRWCDDICVDGSNHIFKSTWHAVSWVDDKSKYTFITNSRISRMQKSWYNTRHTRRLVPSKRAALVVLPVLPMPVLCQTRKKGKEAWRALTFLYCWAVWTSGIVRNLVIEWKYERNHATKTHKALFLAIGYVLIICSNDSTDSW